MEVSRRSISMGLLPDTQNCGLRKSRGCWVHFPRHCGIAIPTCITARAWCTYHDACRDRWLAIFLWGRWWRKLSRHSRCMHNPQFCVFGKRPMIRTSKKFGKYITWSSIKRKLAHLYVCYYHLDEIAECNHQSRFKIQDSRMVYCNFNRNLHGIHSKTEAQVGLFVLNTIKLNCITLTS